MDPNDDRGSERGRSRDPEWDAERAEALRTERHEPARLIWQAWDRDLDREEKDRVRRFVAVRGFDPYREIEVDDELWNVEYEGKVYRPDDRELIGVVHYLKHPILGEEWPPGTPEEQYYLDVADAARHRHGEMFVNRRLDEGTGRLRPQLGIVARTEEILHRGAGRRHARGEGEQRDLLVVFDLYDKHIVTAFQLPDAQAYLERQEATMLRRDVRWLR
jgi:hypothetical protein